MQRAAASYMAHLPTCSDSHNAPPRAPREPGAQQRRQVHTSTDRQDFNYGQFAVIRRFKDFVWLSHRLEDEFPGIVMPALPVKMLVGKFDQTFVEVRYGTVRETSSTGLACRGRFPLRASVGVAKSPSAANSLRNYGQTASANSRGSFASQVCRRGRRKRSNILLLLLLLLLLGT